MMDIHPLMSTATENPDRRIYSHLSRFAPSHAHPHSTMIIDATTHNSSMPVSPKQGETITADGLSKQDTSQLVSSSSWEHLSQKTTPTSSPSPLSPEKSSVPASLNAKVWSSSSSSSSSSSPPPEHQLNSVSDSFQTNPTTADSCCDTWNVDKPVPSPSSSMPSLSTPSAPSLPGGDNNTKDFDDLDRQAPTPTNTMTASIRNCDQPDSSPSSHSLFNSSFDEADQVPRAPEMIPRVENYSTSGMPIDTSYERRSRRKPTIEDIVRRVKPPVDVPPYDSEESEIEDDILNEEMMMKMNRVSENDEVDGTAKPAMRMIDRYEGDDGYKSEYRQFTMDRLSRLEAVDGIQDDDKEMEVRSEEDLVDAEKRAFYRDIPLTIYNIVHEVKVNAHAMFMKTANFLEPEESKVRREQYLLQLLSNLRDRCLEEGIKPEVIGEILKDVESEISLINEDFEEMKMKQYDSEMSAPGVHFLSKHDHRSDDDKSAMNNNSSQDPHGMSYNSTTFLNTNSSLSSSSSSPVPTTPSSISSSSVTTPPAKDVKPIITTISADGIVSTVQGPPPPLINGGLPPLYPASNISETAFSPNMFPGNGKMNSWFPGSLLNNMPFYPFSGSGSPLDHALARKFLPFEGKMGDSVDKDYLKCQFCERTFRRQKNLENHIENTHHGKNPLKTRRDTADMYFKCSHCPYTTKHQSNLYVHLRIHTGERPYMCGACGVQYSQSHSLKSHIINKHDGIMSYYIKEKRTRSPRGIGYLSSQVMHDNTIFKLPPPPLLAPSMHHHANLDFVNKAIEMAKSEHAQQQQQMQLHQQTSPTNHSLKEEGKNQGNGPLNMNMPPPLTPSSSLNASIHDPSTPPSNAKTPGLPPNSSSSYNPNSPSTPLMSTKGTGSPHPAMFMNGHSMPPFMFGELPPHLRNPNQPHPHAHPLFPGLPFPPHSSAGYPGAPGLPPLQAMSPNSASGMPNLPLGMQQMFGNFPHLNQSPLPVGQQPHIKKEAPSQNFHNHQQQQHHHHHPHHHHQQQQQQQQQQQHQEKSISSAPAKRQLPGQQPEEAIDLRKRTPPPPGSYDACVDHPDHDFDMCQEKENCSHAAKLKYLRLNVVRMLGILVPNLNFAEKGISAESESVDELLQDVIESNVPEEEMME